MKHCVLISILLLNLSLYSQVINDLPGMSPKSSFENSRVEQLATDSLCTSFVIWIRGGVQHHFHALHTENIYVLEGAGKMQMADSTFTIKAGDYIMIKKGIGHSLTSVSPMKVLSIQTPEWTVDDRIFVEPTRRPHNE